MSRRPAGSIVWKSTAFGSSSRPWSPVRAVSASEPEDHADGEPTSPPLCSPPSGAGQIAPSAPQARGRSGGSLAARPRHPAAAISPGGRGTSQRAAPRARAAHHGGGRSCRMVVIRPSAHSTTTLRLCSSASWSSSSLTSACSGSVSKPFRPESSLKYTAAPGILRRPLAGVGQPAPADGDVRRHDQVRVAEQAALANQAARGVAHRELVVDGAGVPEPGPLPVAGPRSRPSGRPCEGIGCRVVVHVGSFVGGGRLHRSAAAGFLTGRRSGRARARRGWTRGLGRSAVAGGWWRGPRRGSRPRTADACRRPRSPTVRRSPATRPPRRRNGPPRSRKHAAATAIAALASARPWSWTFAAETRRLAPAGRVSSPRCRAPPDRVTMRAKRET